MKKLFIPVICFGVILFSCEKENYYNEADIELRAQNETEQLDSYLGFISGKSHIGIFADGVYDELTGKGNCKKDEGTCIINMPKKGGGSQDQYHEKIDLELIPCDPVNPEDPDFVSFKNDYFDDDFAALKIKLTDEEVVAFKESMRFNLKNKLVSWDMELLRKGADREFSQIIKNIAFEIMGKETKVVIIDSKTNKEEVVE